MPHLIEAAKSNRASCRGCREKISKGELRFGEETFNNFSSSGGAAYRWYHLKCAASQHPDKLGEAMATFEGELPGRDLLTAAIAAGKAARKARGKPSFPYAERAPSGRSRCRHCEEKIEKGAFRVAVETEVDTGSFVTSGAGYLHPACSAEFTEDPELLQKLREHSALSAEELTELEQLGGFPSPSGD